MLPGMSYNIPTHGSTNLILRSNTYNVNQNVHARVLSVCDRDVEGETINRRLPFF